MKENLYLNLKMTIEYGILALLMGMGAILIGAKEFYNYEQKKYKVHELWWRKSKKIYRSWTTT